MAPGKASDLLANLGSRRQSNATAKPALAK